MPHVFKCTVCGAQERFDSRVQAAQNGWAVCEIAALGRLRYIVLCAQEKPAWLKQALSDPPARKAQDV